MTELLDVRRRTVDVGRSGTQLLDCHRWSEARAALTDDGSTSP
jgi:hypothetical protein